MVKRALINCQKPSAVIVLTVQIAIPFAKQKELEKVIALSKDVLDAPAGAHCALTRLLKTVPVNKTIEFLTRDFHNYYLTPQFRINVN